MYNHSPILRHTKCSRVEQELLIYRENPMMPDDEQSVRERAYQIWEEEGRPEAREQFHWDRAAREMQALRDGKKPTLFNEDFVPQPAPIGPS
jgi:hypothetical protein